MTRLSTTLFALSLTLTLAPGLALAHAHLRSAQPPVGGTVHAAPKQVEITFSEGVEPTLCRVAVTNAGGQTVSQGQPHLGDDNKHLLVGLGALDAGTYHVTWHATSVDTHQTDGTFDFTVAP